MILFAHIGGEERITIPVMFSLVVSVAGVGIIFADRIALQKTSLVPAILALLSSVSFDLYTLCAGQTAKNIGSLPMDAYSFPGGAVLIRNRNGQGSMGLFLKPVVASFLACFSLSESLSSGFPGGTVCIMTGVLLSLEKKKVWQDYTNIFISILF